MPSDAMRVWREALDAWWPTGIVMDEKHPQAAAVIERAIADAVEQERALIVEWLREHGLTGTVTRIDHYIADAIERGDHKERADG